MKCASFQKLRVQDLLKGSLVGVLCLVFPELVSAHSKAVVCPPVVAQRSTGEFRTVIPGFNRAPYECFSNKNDARKAGYRGQEVGQQRDLSGWYRIRLTKVRDSCDDTKSLDGPVLFLQVNQKDKAVFADFCPSLGQLVGTRSGSGLLVSRTENVVESNGPLDCSDGQIGRTDQLEFSPIVKGTYTFAGKYSIVRRCLTGEEATKSCTIEYSGVGFFETHPIWPKVDPNINFIKASCKTALHTCVECHPNLAGIDLEP